MPTVNKIAIHNKFNKNFKNTFQLKIASNSRPLEKLRALLVLVIKIKKSDFPLQSVSLSN